MLTGSVSRRAGGLFQSVRHLSLALHDAGADVRVVGLRDADTAADLDAWLPLRPSVLDTVGPASLGVARGLGAALRARPSDVIHQHGIWQAFSAVTARSAQSVPTVVSPRGMLDPWAIRNSGWKKRLAWLGWEGANLRRAARLHALADAEARAIRDVLPDAEIVTIPNGVTLVPPRKPRIPREGPRDLLFLGRLHPKKGLPDLLRQWHALPGATRRTWRLRIAGPDQNGHREELAKLAEGLGLSGEVTFLGPLSGVAKTTAFEAADAFVLPSHSEGLPMAVLEAWSFGLPVLMTRACNLPEGFAAGAALEIETGDDPGALARALAYVDLEAVGQRGRSLVERDFGWPTIAARHLADYECLMARAGNRGHVAA